MERQQLFREIAYLRSKGLSIRAIAAELGVNRGRVERALKTETRRRLPEESTISPSLPRLSTSVFVGYRRELQQLQDSLEDTLRGRENLVMLVGEPGIGKTRMAQELAGSATHRGAQVLWARYQESLRTPPYWAWAQAVRSYALAHRPEEIRVAMGRGMGYIAEIAPELREIAAGLEPLPQLEPELSRLRLFEAVTTFFRNASSIQPLVFIVDNLHWADRPSLLLLEFLVQELREAPILIVGTYRNEEIPDYSLPRTVGELTKEPGFRRLDLAGFTPEDVESLIKLFGFSNAPQAFVSHVHRRTVGNPLFVTEVVRLLAQQGKLPQPPASAHPTSTISETGAGDGWGLSLPDGVRDAIGRRLSLLSDGCNGMLALASIIGREFGIDVLLRLAREVRQGQLIDLLDEAVAARIIKEVATTVGQYRFTHVLIQETLSSSLSAARRAQLHGDIGETLEALLGTNAEDSAADLAHHFAQAALLPGNQKVARYSLLAGEQALAAFAWEDAFLHYQRGLEAKESEPMDAETAAMLVACGYAQLAARIEGQATDAVVGLNRAFDYYVEVGDLDSALAAAEFPRSTTSGTTPGAAELVERALQLVPPNSLPECRLLLRHGWELGRMRGDYRGAQEAFHRAQRIAVENGHVFLEMQSLAAAAEVDVFNLACREAMVKSRRVIQLADQADDPWAEVQAHQRATLALTIIGDLEGARHHASAASAPAERLQDFFWLGSSLWGKQFVHRMEGNWDAARDASDRLLPMAEAPRNLA